MEDATDTTGALPDIERAIMHAAEAGKLRAYVRKNGSGLAGLTRLAARHSAAASAALDKLADAGGLEIADARLTASVNRGAQGER